METSSSKILVLVKDGENNQRCTSQEAWHGKKLTNASNIAQIELPDCHGQQLLQQ